jgi:hypothetical protein
MLVISNPDVCDTNLPSSTIPAMADTSRLLAMNGGERAFLGPSPIRGPGFVLSFVDGLVLAVSYAMLLM